MEGVGGGEEGEKRQGEERKERERGREERGRGNVRWVGGKEREREAQSHRSCGKCS